MTMRARRGRLLGVGLLLALAACSGPPRSSSSPSAASTGAAPAMSPPARIAWTTPLGSGGAEVAPWPVRPAPQDASLAFSRLLGVVMVPDRNELLFVGVQDDTRSRLDVDDLMDALVIGLGALPGAPGVSIDPTAAQLTRGLRERDEMGVRYIGGDERTIVGVAAFEADRLMKCLSFGRDNISNQPVTCRVPGFQTDSMHRWRNQPQEKRSGTGSGSSSWRARLRSAATDARCCLAPASASGRNTWRSRAARSGRGSWRPPAPRSSSRIT